MSNAWFNLKRNLPCSWLSLTEPNSPPDNREDSPQPGKRRRTQFGLKEFAPGSNPDIDIVAIHGIDGDREDTWTADNGILWLRDLLPEKIPSARILTYGYDANTHGQEQLATDFMYDHAMTFIAKMALFREETLTNNRAILFVAHSSGGILLKSALIHSYLSNDDHLKHHHAISHSTYGVAFFSTPHQGSAGPFLLDIASSSMPSSNVLLRYIERDSEVLQQQLAQYAAISAQYETKFFYELYDTPVAGRLSTRVVSKSSAVVPGAINSEAIGISKDHFNMVKYRSSDDEDFRTVSTTLLLMAKSVQKKMAEKRTRYRKTKGDVIFDEEIDLTPSQQRTLSSLPRVNAARFNADTRPPCLKGTRVSLLKTVREWTEQEASGEHRRIFWLCGQAGTGKTTVSLTMAGDCQNNKRLGASFFFSRDHTERSELQLVFTTLAHQLGVFHKPLQVPLAKVLEEDPDLPHMEPGYQFRKLIVDPLKSCYSFPLSTIVVIDALDECRDKDPISKILSILSAHIHELPQLKFFITSRPEDHIREGFHPLFTDTQTFILHNIKASIVDADIEHYLRHGFSIAKSRYREMATPDWPSDESIKSLVRKSCGLFIFASTAMNFILDRNYDDPPSQLTTLLGQSSVESSPSSFAFLDQLYLQVLRLAFPSETTPLRRLNFLRSILGAIVLLRNPLSPGALENLLGLQTGLVRNTLRRLHSVIVVPDTDEQPMRLIHPSFFDFITTRCSDAGFQINSLVSHEQIAIGCFNKMRCLKRNICEIEDGSKLNTEIEDLPEMIERYIAPAMQYACLYWPFHLCSASGNHLQGMLEEFCRGKILYWIEVLSLLGYLREGIRHLKGVLSCLDIFPTTSEELLQALNDSIQFMIDGFDLISCASLQLYRSALPLSPPSSYLHKTFHHELNGGMRVLQGERVQRSFGATLLRGSKGSISSMDVSPDGRLIVSCIYGEVRLWDLGTGTSIQTLDVDPESEIPWAKFFPDGSRVIIGTAEYTFSTWNVTTGIRLETIQLEGVDRVYQCPRFTISPDFTNIAGSLDNNIGIWASSTGDLLKTLSGHSDKVWSVAFSPDQLLLASGAADHTIYIWNPINGAALRTLQGHSNWVSTISFSLDGKYIVSGSDDHDIRLWNVSSNVALKTLKGHTDSVTSMAISPAGTRVISCSLDHTLRVWDINSGELLKTIKCPGLIGNVGFLADGKHYISSADDIIYIWDANRAYDLDQPEAKDPTYVDFSPGGTYMYGYKFSFLEFPCVWDLWDGLTGTHLFSFQSVNSPSISPNDKYLVSDFNHAGHLRLWDISARTTLWKAPIDACHNDSNSEVDICYRDFPCSLITFSSDGTRIVLSLHDGLQVWDVASGTKLFTINTNKPPPAAFSQDGSQIITKDDRYDLPPYVRPHSIISMDEPFKRIKYLIKGEWVFASNGAREERCVWLPADWIPRGSIPSNSHGRVAIGSLRGVILLDLSSIPLAI